jgi:hypothetical protein
MVKLSLLGTLLLTSLSHFALAENPVKPTDQVLEKMPGFYAVNLSFVEEHLGQKDTQRIVRNYQFCTKKNFAEHHELLKFKWNEGSVTEFPQDIDLQLNVMMRSLIPGAQFDTVIIGTGAAFVQVLDTKSQETFVTGNNSTEELNNFGSGYSYASKIVASSAKSQKILTLVIERGSVYFDSSRDEPYMLPYFSSDKSISLRDCVAL